MIDTLKRVETGVGLNGEGVSMRNLFSTNSNFKSRVRTLILLVPFYYYLNLCLRIILPKAEWVLRLPVKNQLVPVFF